MPSRSVNRLLGLAAAALLVGAPAARADEQIKAGPVQQFTTPNVTIDQGERLTFLNQDSESHDVTSRKLDASQDPLFATPTTDPSQEKLINGSQYLTTGEYPFFCSIHPDMTGTLHVSSLGTPVPRPPDTKAPRLSLKILDSRLGRVLGRRALKVRVKTNEAGKVRLTLRGRGKKIGSKTVKFAKGATKSVRVKLTRRGRKLLKSSDTLRLTLSARATDSAGNITKRTKKRKLK